jgi:hypothetical protein
MTWTESVPSGTSNVGDFPSYAKSIWTEISTGMAVEHFFPGSGGGSDASAGELKPGASRAYFAAQSLASLPSQGTGRAFLASDTSRLLLFTSTRTVLGGTPFFDEVGTSPGEGYWARAAGSYTTTASSGSTTVSYSVGGGFFSATPSVYQTSSNASVLLSRTGLSAITFQSHWSAFAATGGSAFTVYWESLGTATSAGF